MNYIRIFYGMALAGTMALTTVSCTDEKDYGYPLEAAKLIKNPQLSVGDNLPLAVGMKQKIDVVIPDSITHPILKWVSSNPAVASISSDGTVEAKAEGKVTLTLSQDPNMASLKTISVTVMPVAKAIVLNADELFEKTSKPATVTTEPSNAYNVFQWNSSDETVATVDAQGNVKGVAPGTVRITATTTDGSNLGSTAEFTVKAIIPLEKIVLSPIGYDLGIGDEGQVNCILEPSNATVDMLTWSSSDEKVATVNEKGIVKGIGVGSATITAQDPTSGKTESVQVAVGIGAFNQTFGSSAGAWTLVINQEQSVYNGSYLAAYMNTYEEGAWANHLPYSSISLYNATFNVGTYRYLAVKMKRPDLTRGGTIFLDTNRGRYLSSQSFGNNVYSVWGYNNWYEAPWDKPVVVYFDLQNEFGGSYLSTTGTDKLDYFHISIFDLPKDARTYDLYWIHTFKTLEEMEAFIQNNN